MRNYIAFDVATTDNIVEPLHRRRSWLPGALFRTVFGWVEKYQYEKNS